MPAAGEEEFAERSPGRGGGSPSRVWYAAYGSNMSSARLGQYLRGGAAPGAARAHPGCRDPRPPERSVPVTLPGLLYFATESPVWGGGRAFYDPDRADEETPARAHLLTAGQFSDIAAQEMGREPGTDLDLAPVRRAGARLRLGPGRYETLLCVAELDGLPVLTFTAPWGSGDVAWRAPSAGYLRQLGAGLIEGRGWTAARAARYLASRPGARGQWAAPEVRALLTG
ncbi:histone deacetylase [Streptomyces hainanensis]|uniref:Histone deacetylase n=2 Tax=Streptomyces hainanensis TaxID=402648 RepID=A0A4R4SES3_9ACTN|nr:histone deacetylase [Streptomyces hainanensis]